MQSQSHALSDNAMSPLGISNVQLSVSARVGLVLPTTCFDTCSPGSDDRGQAQGSPSRAGDQDVCNLSAPTAVAHASATEIRHFRIQPPHGGQATSRRSATARRFPTSRSASRPSSWRLRRAARRPASTSRASSRTSCARMPLRRRTRAKTGARPSAGLWDPVGWAEKAGARGRRRSGRLGGCADVASAVWSRQGRGLGAASARDRQRTAAHCAVVSRDLIIVCFGPAIRLGVCPDFGRVGLKELATSLLVCRQMLYLALMLLGKSPARADTAACPDDRAGRRGRKGQAPWRPHVTSMLESWGSHARKDQLSKYSIGVVHVCELPSHRRPFSDEHCVVWAYLHPRSVWSLWRSMHCPHNTYVVLCSGMRGFANVRPRGPFVGSVRWMAAPLVSAPRADVHSDRRPLGHRLRHVTLGRPPCSFGAPLSASKDSWTSGSQE